ncbi:MAG TPA: alpha/beta hydrolase [Caulobacteraceae bacterium]|nr:alpha/beta hydrolase [Caulobacteraceae bacterium]
MRSDVLLWAAGAALATAGWVALQRRDIPFAALERKYANAQSRYLGLPGRLRVHYRDEGARRGPALVMAHGFFASLHTWGPWVERLRDRFRIVTVDLPGHGLTRAPADYPMSLERSAEVLDAVAEHLGLGPYVLVGSSMGGGAAWTLAMNRPERLRGLVLVGSIGGPGGDRALRAFLQFLASPWVRPLVRDLESRPFVRRALLRAYREPGLVTPELIDRHIELSRAPSHRDIHLNGGAAVPPAVEAFRKIAVPTLVMHGEADAIVPASGGRWLAATIPGAKLVTYPEVGHIPMEQIPGRSAEDLAEFVDGLAAPEPKPASKRRRGVTAPKTARGRSAAPPRKPR